MFFSLEEKNSRRTGSSYHKQIIEDKRIGLFESRVLNPKKDQHTWLSASSQPFRPISAKKRAEIECPPLILIFFLSLCQANKKANLPTPIMSGDIKDCHNKKWDLLSLINLLELHLIMKVPVIKKSCLIYK